MEFLFSRNTCSDSNFNQKFDYKFVTQGLTGKYFIMIKCFTMTGQQINYGLKNGLQYQYTCRIVKCTKMNLPLC